MHSQSTVDSKWKAESLPHDKLTCDPAASMMLVESSECADQSFPIRELTPYIPRAFGFFRSAGFGCHTLNTSGEALRKYRRPGINNRSSGFIPNRLLTKFTNSRLTAAFLEGMICSRDSRQSNDTTPNNRSTTWRNVDISDVIRTQPVTCSRRDSSSSRRSF